MRWKQPTLSQQSNDSSMQLSTASQPFEAAERAARMESKLEMLMEAHRATQEKVQCVLTLLQQRQEVAALVAPAPIVPLANSAAPPRPFAQDDLFADDWPVSAEDMFKRAHEERNRKLLERAKTSLTPESNSKNSRFADEPMDDEPAAILPKRAGPGGRPHPNAAKNMVLSRSHAHLAAPNVRTIRIPASSPPKNVRTGRIPKVHRARPPSRTVEMEGKLISVHVFDGKKIKPNDAPREIAPLRDLVEHFKDSTSAEDADLAGLQMLGILSPQQKFMRRFRFGPQGEIFNGRVASGLSIFAKLSLAREEANGANAAQGGPRQSKRLKTKEAEDEEKEDGEDDAYFFVQRDESLV